MSSAAQVLANQRNAARSTGPSTPAGKEASSKNATRHGLSGVFTPLPHENRDEFDQLAARLRAEFIPEGENETFLVDQMIQARCRLIRVQRLEDQAYEQILTEPGSSADPDARILAAISQSGNAVDKLQRYRAAAERQYYKALREIQTSRVRTKKAEATALENYITKVIYAPVPGELERKAYHGAVNQFTKEQANLQNEPNSPVGAPRPSCRSAASVSYSYRMATIGSTRLARTAGMQLARNATESRIDATATNVTGSEGLTPTTARRSGA